MFLVAVVKPDATSTATALDTATGIGDLVKNVGFRAMPETLSCVVGFGSAFWDHLGRNDKPAQLHPFTPLQGDQHTAPSTPGDLLFHIRASRMDLCIELGRQIVDQLGDAATVVDEVHGYRYFDSRDFLGFVDGTADPAGDEIDPVAYIGDEDAAFAGGSYVIVQKYVHDLSSWNALTVEEQQLVIGRTKVENIELDDDVKPTNSHVFVNTVVDEDGVEHDIMRYNMPFGTVGDGQVGTYFIGYAADISIVELMLQRMFIGDPPGNTDRILEFSTAQTGTLFFVPSAQLLDELADSLSAGPTAADPAATPEPPQAGPADGSLGIGDLR